MTLERSLQLTRRGFVAGLVAAGAVTPLPRAAIAGTKVHNVAIEGFAFGPATLTARPGDLIRWLNRDIVPHTVSATEGGFDSGKLVKDAAWELTVSENGTVSYFCAFHPNMTGEFHVAVS